MLSLTVVGLLVAATACATAPDAAPVEPPASAAPASAPTRTRSSPAVAAAVGLPRPDHILIVIFENKDVDQVLGNHDAPFLNNLAHTGVDFTNATRTPRSTSAN